MYVFLAFSLLPWLFFGYLTGQKWICRVTVFSLCFIFFFGCGMMMYYMFAGKVFAGAFLYDLKHASYLFVHIQDLQDKADGLGEWLFPMFFILYWYVYIDVIHVFFMFLSNFTFWQIPWLIMVSYICISAYDGIVEQLDMRNGHYDMSLMDWLVDLVLHNHPYPYRSEADYQKQRQIAGEKALAEEARVNKIAQDIHDAEQARKNTGTSLHFSQKPDAWK